MTKGRAILALSVGLLVLVSAFLFRRSSPPTAQERKIPVHVGEVPASPPPQEKSLTICLKDAETGHSLPGVSITVALKAGGGASLLSGDDGIARLSSLHGDIKQLNAGLIGYFPEERNYSGEAPSRIELALRPVTYLECKFFMGKLPVMVTGKIQIYNRISLPGSRGIGPGVEFPHAAPLQERTVSASMIEIPIDPRQFAGSLMLVGEFEKYSMVPVPVIVPREGKRRIQVEAELGLAYECGGRVVETNRRPIPSAYIELEQDGFYLECQSDESGLFSLRGVRLPRTTLHISAKGFRQETTSVDWKMTNFVEVVLKPAEMLLVRGRVTEAGGTPIKGATVRGLANSKATDGEGIFELQVPAAFGDYFTLNVEQPGYARVCLIGKAVPAEVWITMYEEGKLLLKPSDDSTIKAKVLLSEPAVSQEQPRLGGVLTAARPARVLIFENSPILCEGLLPGKYHVTLEGHTSPIIVYVESGKTAEVVLPKR